MRSTILRRWLPGAALLAGLTLFGPGTVAEEPKDEGVFRWLFNGKDLTGWKVELSNKRADPKQAFAVKDRVLVCRGRPQGYIYTQKIYKNYVLRFDWRYPVQDDSASEGQLEGYGAALLHIQPPHKIWPKCLQVEGRNKDPGNIFAIGFKKGEKNPPRFTSTVKAPARDEAIKKAIKKEGEWNTTEITCKDGSITSKVNGIPIDAGKGNLLEGPIGFQAGGAGIELCNIIIKELK
jgi:Domain of Unknown Function (DUF1080)